MSVIYAEISLRRRPRLIIHGLPLSPQQVCALRICSEFMGWLRCRYLGHQVWEIEQP